MSLAAIPVTPPRRLRGNYGANRLYTADEIRAFADAARHGWVTDGLEYRNRAQATARAHLLKGWIQHDGIARTSELTGRTWKVGKGWRLAVAFRSAFE